MVPLSISGLRGSSYPCNSSLFNKWVLRLFHTTASQPLCDTGVWLPSGVGSIGGTSLPFKRGDTKHGPSHY